MSSRNDKSTKKQKRPFKSSTEKANAWRALLLEKKTKEGEEEEEEEEEENHASTPSLFSFTPPSSSFSAPPSFYPSVDSPKASALTPPLLNISASTDKTHKNNDGHCLQATTGLTPGNGRALSPAPTFTVAPPGLRPPAASVVSKTSSKGSSRTGTSATPSSGSSRHHKRHHHHHHEHSLNACDEEKKKEKKTREKQFKLEVSSLNQHREQYRDEKTQQKKKSLLPEDVVSSPLAPPQQQQHSHHQRGNQRDTSLPVSSREVGYAGDSPLPLPTPLPLDTVVSRNMPTVPCLHQPPTSFPLKLCTQPPSSLSSLATSPALSRSSVPITHHRETMRATTTNPPPTTTIQEALSHMRLHSKKVAHYGMLRRELGTRAFTEDPNHARLEEWHMESLIWWAQERISLLVGRVG
ncbi:hypothetical protein CHU98_g6752 [Xylaria longipes]|nr:hypothetical protein CHU98_g6752 [Xylaria longipes]